MINLDPVSILVGVGALGLIELMFWAGMQYQKNKKKKEKTQ